MEFDGNSMIAYLFGFILVVFAMDIYARGRKPNN